MYKKSINYAGMYLIYLFDNLGLGNIQNIRVISQKWGMGSEFLSSEIFLLQFVFL